MDVGSGSLGEGLYMRPDYGTNLVMRKVMTVSIFHCFRRWFWNYRIRAILLDFAVYKMLISSLIHSCDPSHQPG
jgi:hypothetical protein